MDDESAEIELLEQNLHKTRHISKRMISILDGFETRLNKLEKSMVPLHTATQILNRRNENIDKTIAKIDEWASRQDDPAVEEALILRGPQPGQLQAYKDALERLNATIAFKSADASMEAARLVSTGAKKLTQLYTTLVAEASSSTTSSTFAPSSTFSPSSPPSTNTPSLTTPPLPTLITFLRKLPIPSTHPSHPASKEIYDTLKEAQSGYAEMRAGWAVRCLEGPGKRVVMRAESGSVDMVECGSEFGRWVEGLLGIVEDEYTHLLTLAPFPTPTLLSQTYSTLLSPILTLFSSTLTSLISLSKKNLSKYTFLALSSYAALLSSQTQFEEILSRRVGGDSASVGSVGEKNELKDGLGQLRGLCLRSFPELLADLKLAAMGGARGGGGSDTSVKVVDVTTSTLTYLHTIPLVHPAVTSALSALGDGNWKMGEGVQVGNKGPKQNGDVSGDEILGHYIHDVLTALIQTLTTISRTSRRPAFGSIFLLNNLSHIKLHLFDPPPSNSSSPSSPSSPPQLTTLIPAPTLSALEQNLRTAKAGYFDANFSVLMSSLMDDPKDKKEGKGGKKEKFTRFFDLFEEVCERHRMVRVLEGDEAGRRALGEEVRSLVVPSLVAFVGKAKGEGFSKNPQKYIKMSPEEVEKQIRNLFS